MANYQSNNTRCEGCGKNGRQRYQPVGWIGRGASLRSMPRKSLAFWCPTCVADGTMERMAMSRREVNAEWRRQRQASL